MRAYSVLVPLVVAVVLEGEHGVLAKVVAAEVELVAPEAEVDVDVVDEAAGALVA